MSQDTDEQVTRLFGGPGSGKTTELLDRVDPLGQVHHLAHDVHGAVYMLEDAAGAHAHRGFADDMHGNLQLDLLREVHDKGQERLEKEIHSQVNYELQRRWPK